VQIKRLGNPYPLLPIHLLQPRALEEETISSGS